MVVCRAGAYVGTFRQAVLDFQVFAPPYAALAEKLADAVTRHARPVGGGTVARTERIPLSPQTDRFEQTAELRKPAGLKRYREFLQGLAEAGDGETEAVRCRVIRFYGAGEDTVQDASAEKSLEGRE
jgi:hypothetical protein